MIIHCEVGIVPVSKNAHSHKVSSLFIDLGPRVITTLLAKLSGSHFDPRLADFLFHIQFDGQTMAVPSRNIGRIVSIKGARFDDDVLENFVHAVTHVQVAVGIGRTIMKNKLRSSCAGLTNFPVQVHVLPLLQALGLTLGEAGFHGKRRFRQVQGVFVVAHITRYACSR